MHYHFNFTFAFLPGAIFEEGEASLPLVAAFRHGIDMVNADRTILMGKQLRAEIVRVAPSNSFKASIKG